MDEPKKTKQKKKNQIPFRLNVLFLFVFLAFSVLIIRLGVVQIVNGDTYDKKMQSTQHVTNKIQSARGLIYDRNGVLLAGNSASPGVIFTRNQDMSETDLINIAKKLSKYLTVTDQKNPPSGVLTTAHITERDLKDYWIGTHPDAYQQKLSAKEQNSKNAYDMLLNRITSKDLSSIKGDELKVVAIWHQLAQASNLSPTVIASNLTTGELARLGEHLNDFKGAIDTTVSANRTYPDGNLFFLGKVSQIPKHEVNNYLASGNNRDDLVGTSNLEEEYNDVLSGIPKTLTYTTDNGKPVGTPTVKEGRRGDDLVLTVDSKLQKQVNQIIQKNIKLCYPSDHLCNQAYVVVMNPHTGAILAAAGQEDNGGQFTDVSEGTILNSFAIGSAVKGATVLAGYQNNAIPGVLNDKPINYVGGGSFKSLESWIGNVNTAQALEVSSNVYMGTIAARMAGFKITDQGANYLARVFTGPKFYNAFNTLRDAYGQFGLGVQTGVDLPYESTGYQGPKPNAGGLIMQFAIGQYDTYTPLQMAQYVSTLANGGYRVAPHFLDSIHYPGSNVGKIGPTEYKYQTKILNTIPNTPSQFAVVHEGFHLVTHGPEGTARTLGYSFEPWAKYDIAAKTGTAQVGDPKLGRNNKTLVAYAPSNNPQVAISVVVPDILNEQTNLMIAGEVFDAYFKSQEAVNK
ncbi:penicillin-binding protein 2 [Pullulanibacillus sp. KACC 23026]|uniref:peptidoglycan D,D-transpeptidase FtsI family protein n=1 Tax=Pullulanibacillus sp. KACC 23026 TaxID=3028315 RepID=UPI0023B1AD5B|nr:penicillin-binding protein 2 [Pullulanibacillus sp. KACC 23026]WEG14262.1 penicillin-binding protein 2 [Pullulanibacillus sp. KACC 23026]